MYFTVICLVVTINADTVIQRQVRFTAKQVIKPVGRWNNFKKHKYKILYENTKFLN